MILRFHFKAQLFREKQSLNNPSQVTPFYSWTTGFSTCCLSHRALFAPLHIRWKDHSVQAYLLQYFQLSCFKAFASRHMYAIHHEQMPKKKSYKNLLCVVKEDVSSHGASMLHHGCVFLAVLHVGVCY